MGWHDVYREARARAQEPQRSSCSIGDIPAGVRKCWPSLTWTNEQQIEMFSIWVGDLVIVETGSSTLADAALNVPTSAAANTLMSLRLVVFRMRGYRSPRSEGLQAEFSGPHW